MARQDATTLRARRPASRGPSRPITWLGLGACGVIGLEVLRGGATRGASWKWLVAECLVAAVALLLAWRRQDGLRLAPLLVVTAGFHLALVSVHLVQGISADTDIEVVYRRQASIALGGSYPDSEYPPGAVVLFALDSLLGQGSLRAAHALVMVPFSVLAVAAIWALRTPFSAWLAAVFGLLPGELYFWEYRFDLVPAALLALALTLSSQRRWRLAAAVFALGTWVKWLPALAAAGVGIRLGVHRSRWREARLFAGTFAAVLVLAHLPFLLWSPRGVLHAYTTQGSRGITGESLPFLPLHALGLAQLPESGYAWDESLHPGWADAVSILLQGVLVAAAVVVTARTRSHRGAVAASGLVPAVFILTNRIFSPQFVVVLAVAWLVAGALVCRTRREQLALATAVLAATSANALVYPALINLWLVASTAFFLVAAVLTGTLLAAIARHDPEEGAPPLSPPAARRPPRRSPHPENG